MKHTPIDYLLPVGLVAGITLVITQFDLVYGWVVITHPLIAVAYITLATVFMFIRLPTHRETAFARSGAALFFLGCALHHLDMWVHITDGAPMAATAFHHHIAATMQLVGAPLFLMTMGPYVKDFFLLLSSPRLSGKLRELAKEGK